MGLREFVQIFKKTREAYYGAIASGYSDIVATEHPALENSAFWCCIMNLCRNYASLPIHVYKKNSDGSRSLDEISNTYRLLTENPCPYMTSEQWRFVMGFNFEMFGVATAIIEYGSLGLPIMLSPVSPNLLTPTWKDGKLFYTYCGTGNTGEVSPSERVLTIYNTPVGYTTQAVLNPVDYAYRDLEAATQSKILETNYYKNATTLGGILKVPKTAPKEVMEQMKATLDQYTGMANAHKTMVIKDDMNYEPLSFKDNDMTKLEAAQNWTVKEICRRFSVPPFIAGDVGGVTYGSSEQQAMQFVTNCLRPRIIMWEKALKKALCTGNQYIKFNLSSLMRGDSASRSAFYHNGIMDGWLSINEVRESEDMNPTANGDQHFFPMNYTTLDKVGQTTVTDPFDLPYDEKKEEVKESIQERQNKFVEEVGKISKTNRQKVESLMRKQNKRNVEALEQLWESGLRGEALAKEFNSIVDSISTESADEYADVYKKVMSALNLNLERTLKRKCDIDSDVFNAYASKFGIQSAYRFGVNRKNDVARRNPVEREELDSVEDMWLESSIKSESDDETSRASNCFNVFLFKNYNITMMKVVSSADACEFCSELDGRVVEVDGTILTKGDSSTDSQGNVRHIHKNYKHPPFHSGCHCTVVPEMK